MYIYVLVYVYNIYIYTIQNKYIVIDARIQNDKDQGITNYLRFK